mgnify:CR=1 FL=1
MHNQSNHFMQNMLQRLYKEEWKTNDINGYLQGDSYKKLSQTIHGKPEIYAKIKFAWLPTKLKNKKFIWFKKYIERNLIYLNVRGKEKLSTEDYVLTKLKYETF